MMLYRSPDGSFIIYNTVNSLAPAKCLHIQPGVVNFPGRCTLPPNHVGRRHEGGAQWLPNGEQMAPEVWGDDDA
jgi:hypothetical protein